MNRNIDLLNENIMNTRIFQIFSYILKNRYEQKNIKSILSKINGNNKLNISYDEFIIIIQEFVVMIMKTYLKETDYENDKCSCVIKNIGVVSGCFDPKNNQITISKDIIKKIYHGDILELFIIFHELNHFKIKYDIRLGVSDQNLTRIVKEKLLISCYSNYYNDNYEIESEEVYANILGILNLVTFIHNFKIKISLLDLKSILYSLSQYKEKYQYYRRDMSSFLEINSYYLDFREAFDIVILHHPEWLSYSQIKGEYYRDEDGKVKKYNNECLKDESSKKIVDEKNSKLLKMFLNGKIESFSYQIIV